MSPWTVGLDTRPWPEHVLQMAAPSSIYLPNLVLMGFSLLKKKKSKFYIFLILSCYPLAQVHTGLGLLRRDLPYQSGPTARLRCLLGTCLDLCGITMSPAPVGTSPSPSERSPCHPLCGAGTRQQ